MIAVVMGVSGSGKSTVGCALAERIGAEFLEGDDLHEPAAKASMATGAGLDDAARAPWLEAIAGRIGEAQATGRGLVVACSALRRRYRDRLRRAAPVRFVHLAGAEPLLRARLAGRAGHFAPPELLGSQLADFETPAGERDILVLDAARPVGDLVEAAAAWLREEAAI